MSKILGFQQKEERVTYETPVVWSEYKRIVGSEDSKLKEKEARVTYETSVVCSEHKRIEGSEDSKLKEKKARVTYIGGTESDQMSVHCKQEN